MRMRTIAIGLLVLSTSLAVTSNAAQWRGITPLRSTRADVERVIGSKPMRCGGLACIYDLGDETAFVLYASSDTCKNDDASTKWKVPRDTVVEIDIHFKTERRLEHLGIDLTKYEKWNDAEMPSLYHYANYDEGLKIEVSGNLVRTLVYGPTAKDADKLACPVPDEPKTIEN